MNVAYVMSLQHNFIQKIFLLKNNYKTFFLNPVDVPYLFITSDSDVYLVYAQ